MVRRAAILALSLSLGGCFAVNDPEAHLPDPLAAEDFCVTFAQVLCDAVSGCCDLYEFELSTCVERVGLSCTDSLSGVVTDPRTGYDAEEAAIQLTIGAQLASTCDPEFFAWYQRRDRLLSFAQGSVDPGGSCDPLGTEQATDLESARFYSCRELGICTADSFSGPWACERPAAMGEPCLPRGAGCQVGLSCLEGTCGPRSPLGGPCFIDADCESYVCFEALSRDGGAAGVCADAETGYCQLLDGCDYSRIGYLPAGAGPFELGGSCDELVVCADTMELADALAGTGRFRCEATTGAICSGTPARCVYENAGMGLGTIDLTEIGLGCMITALPGAPEVWCVDGMML